MEREASAERPSVDSPQSAAYCAAVTPGFLECDVLVIGGLLTGLSLLVARQALVAEDPLS